jgi:hypothetical protein
LWSRWSVLLQCTQPHAGLECHAHTQSLCVAGWFGCGPPATGTRRCFAWPAFICLLPGARVCCMRCISFLQHSTRSTYMCWCRCVLSCTQAFAASVPPTLAAVFVAQVLHACPVWRTSSKHYPSTVCWWFAGSPTALSAAVRGHTRSCRVS